MKIKLLKSIKLLAVWLGIVILFLELWLRFGWVASEKPYAKWDDTFEIVRFIPNKSGHYTLGKFGEKAGAWSTNNYGWVSNADYQPETDKKHRIGIIGDSYVEALQVDTDKAFHSLLRNRFKDSIEVINVGYSGASFADYYVLAKYLKSEFNPDFYLLNVIHNDFDESLCKIKSADGHSCVEFSDQGCELKTNIPAQKESKWSTKLLSNFATFRYFTSNIKLKHIFKGGQKLEEEEGDKEEVVYNNNVNVKEVTAIKAEIEATLDCLFNKYNSEFDDKKFLLVIDGLRKDIYEGNEVDERSIMWMNDLVLKLASKYENILAVDMTKAMEQDYKTNQKHFEFEVDWHWNEYGHKFTADFIENYIRQNSQNLL